MIIFYVPFYRTMRVWMLRGEVWRQSNQVQFGLTFANSPAQLQFIACFLATRRHYNNTTFELMNLFTFKPTSRQTTLQIYTQRSDHKFIVQSQSKARLSPASTRFPKRTKNKTILPGFANTKLDLLENVG